MTFALAAALVSAAEVNLVENGKVKCAIAVGANASRPERFGAGEIGRYLQKVTGCDEVPVLADVDPKRWTDWRKLVFVEVRDLPELKPDGFVLDVCADGVTITGKDSRGALYGCYEVLKRWAGLRWLVPGEDGEYFTKKATVAAPVGRIVRNPFLPVRIFNGGLTTIEQHEWSIRNCAEADEDASAFEGTDVESVRRRDRLEDLAVCGMGRWGHVLSELMLGPGDGKTPPRSLAEKLYAEHPEFFPLVDGKRKMTWGAYDPNPCVSNPALLDRMAKHMVEGLRGKRNCEAHLILGNNDTSAWCECEACRALDDPAKAGSRGARSDRFWFMVAELARRVWAELPDAKLGGWAYQDFWYPPTRVRIDPRLRVLVSFNNTCWRHAVDDPACGTNAEFRRVFGAWKKLGLVVYSFDDVHDEGSPGSYSPSEYVLWRNMLAYPELGCCGDRMAIYSPIPPYHKWAAKAGPFYGRNYRWLAMWQSCWLMAQVQWDSTLDFAKLYEECNSLYYGKAWAGGMREFRQYLTECYTNTPGCIGYGSGAPIGKSLDAPGSREKLEALLDKAILAAVAAGDERAQRHVETDRDIFRLTWLAGHDRYLRNYLESEAFARKGEIVVDGVLDEADWRDAKTIAGFERGYENKPSEPADVKTEARVVYDRNHLYFAVTAYEPDMASVRCGKPAEVDRDSGFARLGDHIELYYQYPDMFEKAYHLAINPEGAIVDAIQKSTAERDRTFRTKAKVAVKKDADRWTVEAAVPANEIGLAPMKGMTWRVNFGRTRYLPGGRHEDTSACHGVFYSPSKFINLKLN